MNKQDILDSLDDDIVARFKQAIETGKWPDGKKLSDEQREICMRAIIVYEHEHLPEEQRTGYVPAKESACEKDRGQEEKIHWK